MSWQEIVRQLHVLYCRATTRDETPQSYIDEAVRLNTRLFKIIGKNYCDLSPATIANCVQ